MSKSKASDITKDIQAIEKQMAELIEKKNALVRQQAIQGGFVKEGEFALVTLKAVDKEEDADLTSILLFNAFGLGAVVMNAYIDLEYADTGYAQIKQKLNHQLRGDNVQVKSVKKIGKEEAVKYL